MTQPPCSKQISTFVCLYCRHFETHLVTYLSEVQTAPAPQDTAEQPPPIPTAYGDFMQDAGQVRELGVL